MFRKITLFCAFLALLVVVLGSYVRLSEAGLGCPDWPACYGQVVIGDAAEFKAEAEQAFPGSSVDVSKFLLKKALVVTVPGREFGMEGHIRLSFSGTVKDVTEGLARIKWALDPTSPNEIYIGDRKLIRDWL